MTPKVRNLGSALVSLLNSVVNHGPWNIVCLNPLKEKSDELRDGSKQSRTNLEDKDTNASIKPETRNIIVQAMFIW